MIGWNHSAIQPFKTNARRGRDKDQDSDKCLYLTNATSGERPHTVCIKEYPKVENYIENAYKRTNTMFIFHLIVK